MIRLRAQLRAEWAIVGPLPWILLSICLLSAGLTQGVLEQSARWQGHLVANVEAFLSLALALSTAPLLTLEYAQGMIELSHRIPLRRSLHLRWLAVWGPFLLILGVGLWVIELFGAVNWWSLALAVLGPGAFFGGLSLLAASISGKAALGYVSAIALFAADLVLRGLGVFASAPRLQWINAFAYRWQLPVPAWQGVYLAQLAAGLVFIEAAILLAPSLYRRLL